ncbi:AAA family ATPase [Chryseobacterium sp.]|uniref:AAA family ATPase n=1 Tax=Chryseobacterium sp. TaxID=1871047 RepID=UPI003341FA6E
MRPIEIIGIKNFRIFDDTEGFFEQMSAINILTGANSSGKSSVIKALQMLKNSVTGNLFPYGLDLTDQEHLLGDFKNLLHDETNKDMSISLPLTFLGWKTLYISLGYTVSDNDTYKAELRRIEVSDITDKSTLFSFYYREATQEEKAEDAAEFMKNQVERVQEKKKQSTDNPDNIFLFSYQSFLDYSFEDPPVAFMEWNIDLAKLKTILASLLEFYKIYLDNNNAKWLERADEIAQEHQMPFRPSQVVNSFKADLDLEKWKTFVEKSLKEDQISGKLKIGQSDFQPDDYFFPVPEVEDVFNWKILEILGKKLNWKNEGVDGATFNVIEEAYKRSLDLLNQRILGIHYHSTVREQNARVYNISSNSPFTKLLRDYQPLQNGRDSFVNRYLNAFKIGKRLKIEHRPDYQLIFVSVVAEDGENRRDLVDFGYGIKQLVLILVRIAVLAEKNKRSHIEYDDYGDVSMNYRYNPSTLIVEEPESHLHPRWQSILAEMFVEANRRFNIQFIIESHSEYLIRKFQTLVADKSKINKVLGKDIKIFYLRGNKDSSSDRKLVETTYIEDDGSIDYKIFDDGFFDQADDLEMSLLNIQRDQFFREFKELKEVGQNNEKTIAELESKIDQYASKTNISAYRRKISDRFDISKLMPDTVDYLTSGQFLLHTIPDTEDFSPVIIQYGRALENELKPLFLHVLSTKLRMLGPMQERLEKFKSGTRIPNELRMALTSKFYDPRNLKVELIDNLRSVRNDSGHSGLKKSKIDALQYIEEFNTFFDSWIAQLK